MFSHPLAKAMASLTNNTLSKDIKPVSTPKIEDTAVFKIEALCAERKLSATLFQNQKMELKDTIEKHATWMYRNIYSIPYANEIARPYHGIQHVSRTAMYARVFVRLYQRYQDSEALGLNETDIKLLQIAMLLHDSARMRDGKDYWDRESGIFVYEYLTRVLKVNAEKAKLLAEAVTTNKEPKEGKYYYKITVLNDGSYRCDKTAYTKKNIYQRIIQNADCFDIMRIRKVFILEYSDFFQDIVINKNNTEAFEEIAHLIVEIRSILTLHGEDCDFPDRAKKKKLDNESYYSELMKCVFDQDNEITANYHILAGLYPATSAQVNKNLLGHLLERKLDTQQMVLSQLLLDTLMWKGRLLARAVDPTSEVKRPNKATETGIGFEVRKIKRRIGIPTRSKKKDRTKKFGFDTRSASMIGAGGTLFKWADSGYVFMPDMNHVQKVSTRNCRSGFGKKEKMKPLPLSEAEIQLIYLNKFLKKGGDPMAEGSRHTEVICRVTEAHAVFYSRDAIPPGSSYKTAVVPKLNAILIQKEFQNQMNVSLPIVRYSYKHNMIKIRNFTDEAIKQLWHNLFTEYLKRLNENDIIQLGMTSKKLNDVKENSVGVKYCGNYDKKLKSEIDGILEKEVLKKMKENYQNNETLLVRAIAKGNFFEKQYNELLALFSFNAEIFSNKLMAFIKQCLSSISLVTSSIIRAEYLDNLKNLYRFAVIFNFPAQQKEIKEGMEEALSMAVLDVKSNSHRLVLVKSWLDEHSLLTPNMRSRVVLKVTSKINWEDQNYSQQLFRANVLFSVYEHRELYRSFKEFFTAKKLSQLNGTALENYCVVANSYEKYHPDISHGNYHLIINNILNEKYLKEKGTLSHLINRFKISDVILDEKLRVIIRNSITDMNEGGDPFGMGVTVALRQLRALYRFVSKYKLASHVNVIKEFMIACYHDTKFVLLINHFLYFFKEFGIDPVIQPDSFLDEKNNSDAHRLFSSCNLNNNYESYMNGKPPSVMMSRELPSSSSSSAGSSSKAVTYFMSAYHKSN